MGTAQRQRIVTSILPLYSAAVALLSTAGPAHALLPECVSDSRECLFSFNQVFGDAVQLKYDGDYQRVLESEQHRQEFCDPLNWAKRSELCGECRYRLHLTAPESVAGMSYCLNLLGLSGFPEENMMHLAHPLNGKPVDLVYACGAFSGKETNLSQSIVFHDLACAGLGDATADMMQPSDAAGAAISIIMLDPRSLFSAFEGYPPGSSLPFSGGYIPFYGVSELSDLPAIREAYATGQRPQGKVTFSCPQEELAAAASGRGLDVSQYYSDTCPYFFNEKMMCESLVDPEMRLCQACPLEAQDPATRETIACLWSPDLLPSRRGNVMEGAFQYPMVEDVVFVDIDQSSFCTNGSMDAFAGRVVLYTPRQMDGNCSRLRTLQVASAAGVKAAVVVGGNRGIWGPAFGVDVPTACTKEPSGYVPIKRFMQGGVKIREGVWSRSMRFEKGVMPPPPAKIEEGGAQSIPVAAEDDSGILSETGVMFSLAALPLSLLVLLVVLCRRRASPVLPPEYSPVGGADCNGKEEVGVTLPHAGMPLSWCTTALALSLIVCVAALVMVMSYIAGERGVQTASDDAEANVDYLNDLNLLNVNTMTTQYFDQMVYSLTREFRDHIEAGLEHAKPLVGFARQPSELMNDFNYFREQVAVPLWRAGSFSKHVTRTRGYVPWQFQLFMDNGFYTDSSRHINNYHEDGGDGGINRTNAAGLYGFMKREGDLGVGVAYTFTRAEHDPFLHLFSSPLPKGTDATQFVESLDNDFFAGTTYATECAEEWHLSANGNGPPITVLLPVYNGQGEVHAEKPNGLLSISLPLLQLATEMLSVLSEQAQLQENMTVAFFDSRGIIFVSNHRMFKMTESLQETDKMGTCLHTVRNTPRIEVNALANKLIADYGTLTPEPKVRVRNSVVSFQFDQRAYYGGDSSVLIDIPMDGNVRDVSGSEWDTRLHGCTNACFIKNPGDEATDDMSPEARRPEDHHHLSVLRLNGTQAVEILPYLTTRVPRVRSTSVKGTLDWHSTRSLYRTARPHDGVADVIHVAKPGRQAEPLLRERPIYNNEYTVAMYIRPAESQQEDSHRMQDKRRLFSDSRSVDGAVRLYADASFKVSLVRVGCSTPGMDIPHSVWTHVAATADFLTRSCVVFVNGTEVGRSRMRHSLYLPRLYGSYWIGEGFKGDIDGFKLLNRTSTAGDVRMLMATGEGVEAPSKLWSASLLTSHKATNIFPAAHAVLVPTEDVIRDVELNTQQINLVVAQQRSNTEWRHQRKSAETIAVAMVIVVAATCIFVVFNRLITTPFADFARDIHAVATMHVERVSASNSTSTLLREINVMNEAMNLLVSNMREYKTFLPESIFLLQQAASSVSEREAPGTETGQAAVVFTDIKQSSQLWETCHEGMRTGLRQHNAAVRECIDECAGYEVKTIGDSFMVAFDTLDSAVRFGLRVQERLTQVAWPESLLELAPCERDPTGDWAGIRVRIGVNYGPVSVEYNEVVGRSDYFGPTVNRAARLESCCVAGAVAVTDDMLVMLGDNMREQVHVMELGPRVLRGIADGVRVSVLIPKSLRRRAERVRNDLLLVRPNPLMSRIRDAERASDQGGLPNESSSDSTGSHRVRVADGIVRFTETMAAINNSTTGQVGETLPEVSVRGPKDITFSVNATVMRIVSCLERSDGQVITVVGGAAVVGWNVTSPCVAHMEGAFRFVGMLSRSAGDKLRCGLSSGRIMTGYVGSSGQRYVTAVGPCMQQCAALFYKAEALDANALYASWERSAADVTALGRFLRPIDELHIASRCMTVHEMWCRILRDWCGEKLTAQFGMPTRLAGAVGDAFTPPGDAPLLTAAETGCWTDQYRNAWRSRDFATLDALAQLDPMVAKASRIRRAMAPDDA